MLKYLCKACLAEPYQEMLDESEFTNTNVLKKIKEKQSSQLILLILQQYFMILKLRTGIHLKLKLSSRIKVFLKRVY